MGRQSQFGEGVGRLSLAGFDGGKDTPAACPGVKSPSHVCLDGKRPASRGPQTGSWLICQLCTAPECAGNYPVYGSYSPTEVPLGNEVAERGLEPCFLKMQPVLCALASCYLLLIDYKGKAEPPWRCPGHRGHPFA